MSRDAGRSLWSRIWATLVAALGTTTLAVVIFSWVVPVALFGVTLVHDVMQRKSGVSMLQIIHGSFFSWPTLLSAGISIVAWLLLLAWASVKTIQRDQDRLRSLTCDNETLTRENTNLKERLEQAKRDASMYERLETKTHEATSIGLSLLLKRQDLEAELQPLQEREDFGITARPVMTFGAGKDDSDYRREKIARLKRDIAEIGKQLEALDASGLVSDTATHVAAVGQLPRLACVETHTQGLYDIYPNVIGCCALIKNVEQRYDTLARNVRAVITLAHHSGDRHVIDLGVWLADNAEASGRTFADRVSIRMDESRWLVIVVAYADKLERYAARAPVPPKLAPENQLLYGEWIVEILLQAENIPSSTKLHGTLKLGASGGIDMAIHPESTQ